MRRPVFYNVQIRVAGIDPDDGEEGYTLDIDLGGIKREDIMREGYSRHVQLAVKLLEYHAEWDGEESKE